MRPRNWASSKRTYRNKKAIRRISRMVTSLQRANSEGMESNSITERTKKWSTMKKTMISKVEHTNQTKLNLSNFNSHPARFQTTEFRECNNQRINVCLTIILKISKYILVLFIQMYFSIFYSSFTPHLISLYYHFSHA